MTAKIKAQNNKFFDHPITKLKENDFKLTKSWIDILTTLSKHEQALSPYQIQDILKETGKNYSAITIYRVLETFMSIDIIHKVHSINSYMKCVHDHDHSHSLLVCKSCHSVEAIERERKDMPQVEGFVVKEVVDEIVGLCKACDIED